MSFNVTTKSADFLAGTRERSTTYALTAKSPITNEQILEIVNHAVRYTPSSFNIQPLRAVVLFGEHHTKFWDLTLDALRAHVDAERFKGSEAHIKGAFQSGYFTILYFTDETVIQKGQADFPSYKASFPVWADNSQGILQGTIWTALNVEGLSGSLQHYHPLIDAAVRKEFNIPETWKFSAQAPFGVAADSWVRQEKPVVPLSERVKVFQ